ncbi:transposase-like protein [Spirosoma lacussanchae]|uniref:hypothetical protein n=1 Tax=Spirosoma lacussanchae TaxID=1884249 RepID=UPI0011099585|nr:hypothetical protein [Spirosoma lacussanchae]
MKTQNIKEVVVDEVTAALCAFLERKGGYQTVAREMGVNPQHLYYVISGRNKPTLKTVMSILKFYPQEKVLREALSLPMPAPAPPADQAEPSADVATLLRQLELKEKELAEVKQRNEELQKEVLEANREFRQLAINFPASSSHATEYFIPGRVEVHGFRPSASTLPAGPLDILTSLGFSETAAGWILG